jgi:hypothetical protein
LSQISGTAFYSQNKEDTSSGICPRLLTYLRKVMSYSRDMKTHTCSSPTRGIYKWADLKRQSSLLLALRTLIQKVQRHLIPKIIMIKALLIRNLSKEKILDSNRIFGLSLEVIICTLTNKFYK